MHRTLCRCGAYLSDVLGTYSPLTSQARINLRSLSFTVTITLSHLSPLNSLSVRVRVRDARTIKKAHARPENSTPRAELACQSSSVLAAVSWFCHFKRPWSREVG